MERNYNEDTVSIWYNIDLKSVNPNFRANQDYTHIPTCSFFAIYDGHGGKKVIIWFKIKNRLLFLYLS